MTEAMYRFLMGMLAAIIILLAIALSISVLELVVLLLGDSP